MRGFVAISRNASIESGCDAGSHKLVDYNGTSTIVHFEFAFRLFFLRLMAKLILVKFFKVYCKVTNRSTSYSVTYIG